jgi:hypothetical protein
MQLPPTHPPSSPPRNTSCSPIYCSRGESNEEASEEAASALIHPMNQEVIISTEDSTYKTIATRSTTKIELERTINSLRRLSVDNCTSGADSSLAAEELADLVLTNSSVADNNNMLGMDFTTSKQQLLINGGVEDANTNAKLNRPLVGLVACEGSEQRRRGMDPPPTELLVVYSDHSSSQPPQDNNRKEEAIEAYKKIYTSKVSSTSYNNSSSNNGAGTGQELALRKESSTSTTTTLTQEFDHCFVKVPRTERLSVLFATLRRSLERKVIVVCSTWESCHFHAILFRQLEMAHVYELHEGMDNVARAYNEYAQYYPGILFASEMQIREFDIPSNVDYMVQYEPPMNPTEYIYRMSTTRLQERSCHKALLFLTAEENKFLHYFTDQECNVMELEARKVSKFHTVVEALVSKHPKLNCYAWDAFRSFMVAYKNHSHVDVYDRSAMDESEVVRSFGMPKDPSGIVVVRNCKELVVTTNNNSSKNVDTTTMKKNVEKVRRLTSSENSSNSSPPSSQKPGWMKGEGTWRERNSVNKSWSNNQKIEDTSTRNKKEEMVDEESIWKKTVGTERTWRTGHKTKSWMTKDKTWKHSHVHL